MNKKTFCCLTPGLLTVPPGLLGVLRLPLLPSLHTTFPVGKNEEVCRIFQGSCVLIIADKVNVSWKGAIGLTRICCRKDTGLVTKKTH